MEYPELRAAFILALQCKSKDNWLELRDFVFKISLICLEKNIVTNKDLSPLFNLQKYKVEKKIDVKFKEKYWSWISRLFWEFVMNGTISIGSNIDHCNLPYFQITDYGKEWLNSKKEPIPEDTEGYIKFMKKIRYIDRVILQYINETLKTFNKRYVFASAVMIGAASEKIIYLLAEALEKSSIDQKFKKNISDKIEGRSLFELIRLISKIFKDLIKTGKIPYGIHEDSKDYLFSLFNAIRIQRNNAVHPIAGKVSKDQLRLLLLAFPHICKKAYDFLSWLNKNQI